MTPVRPPPSREPSAGPGDVSAPILSIDEVLPVTVAVVATGGLLVLGAATGQLNWQVYAAVVAVGIVGATMLHLHVGLSRLTIWGLVIFGISHVAGGMVPVGGGTLYQWWLVDDLVRYDNLQHAWGFGFVGRATWEALRARLAPLDDDLPTVALWVVVLGATAFGGVNEIIEYGLTLTLAATNVGGYDNTARDLVANLAGGLLVGAYTRQRVAMHQRAAQHADVHAEPPVADEPSIAR